MERCTYGFRPLDIFASCESHHGVLSSLLLQSLQKKISSKLQRAESLLVCRNDQRSHCLCFVSSGRIREQRIRNFFGTRGRAFYYCWWVIIPEQVYRNNQTREVIWRWRTLTLEQKVICRF